MLNEAMKVNLAGFHRFKPNIMKARLPQKYSAHIRLKGLC